MSGRWMALVDWYHSRGRCALGGALPSSIGTSAWKESLSMRGGIYGTNLMLDLVSFASAGGVWSSPLLVDMLIDADSMQEQRRVSTERAASSCATTTVERHPKENYPVLFFN